MIHASKTGMEKPEKTSSFPKRRTAWILGILFGVAIVMGPGPGIYLINPDPEGSTSRLFLGLPIVYAWAAFWFLCQAVAVVLAYRMLWKEEE